MRGRTTKPDEIDRVRRQLEQWHRRGDRGRRIPASLWEAMVKLARGHGVSKTSRAPRLDYSWIKKRLEATPLRPPGPIREGSVTESVMI